MSSPPSELPEPLPSRKPSPPRGRDRALSAPPTQAKQKKTPPPPVPRAEIGGNGAKPPYEFGATTTAALPAAAAPSSAVPARARDHRLAWFVVLAVIGTALAFTVPFTLGVYLGNREREQFVERQALEHFQRALTYESETYTALAIAELNVALQYKPDYQPAREKLAQLKQIHVAAGSQEPQDVAIANQLYEGAQQALDNEAWNEAIDLLEELRRVKNNFRAREVEADLVRAYLAAGKEALAAKDVDLARRRFDAALTLDPSNAEARTFHDRAILYFNALAAMGSDWQSAVLALEELFRRDPNFGDVRDKLREAHMGYGQFAEAQAAYCIAAREYDAALSLGATGDARPRALAANEACKQAILHPTATPTPTVEGGEFGTPFPPGTPAPNLAPGTIVYTPQMRVRQNARCNGTGDIRGSVNDLAGNPLPNVGVKIYNDYGYLPPYARTDLAGEYEFVLGSDKGLFHLVIVDDFGSNVSAILDVDYPGGNEAGCHLVVEWTRIR